MPLMDYFLAKGIWKMHNIFVIYLYVFKLVWTRWENCRQNNLHNLFTNVAGDTIPTPINQSIDLHPLSTSFAFFNFVILTPSYQIKP